MSDRFMECGRCGARFDARAVRHVCADTSCPSCHGHGWATIRAGGITVAGGRCRCAGGQVWAAASK